MRACMALITAEVLCARSVDLFVSFRVLGNYCFSYDSESHRRMMGPNSKLFIHEHTVSTTELPKRRIEVT